MSFELGSKQYDAMIDWDARLKRELPFYKTLFARYTVQSVLDCACATGRHAIEFAKQGYSVVGSDISFEMLEQAQQNAKKSKFDLDFVQADFRKLTEYIPCQFDAIICTGNSIVQLPHEKDLGSTLRQMRKVLNPKGILIIQILNFKKLMMQDIAMLPLRTVKDGKKEFLYLRIYQFPNKKSAQLQVITLTKQQQHWSMHPHTTPMLAVAKPKFQQLLRAAGFHKCYFYGDFKFSPFSEHTSSDLIIVAQK
ncbi:MAG: class I SAM-dependent methyltransferase [bacterium]